MEDLARVRMHCHRHVDEERVPGELHVALPESERGGLEDPLEVNIREAAQERFEGDRRDANRVLAQL